jgi:hypothetical protein
MGPLPLARGLYAAESKRRAPSALHGVAVDTLSSPTESAALLVTLLDVHGVDACDYGCDSADVRVYLVSVYGGEGTKVGDRVGCWIVGETHPLPKPDVPALILALLRLATGDRDGALAALRGAS